MTNIVPTLKDEISFDIKKKDADQPLFRLANKIVIAKNKGNLVKTYNKFYSNLEIYLNKLPDSFAVDAVRILLEKKLIFFGFVTDRKIGLIGRAFIANHKLAGIALDSSFLNIDYETGDVENIDNVLYAIYFLFIRSVVVIHESQIKKDTTLHELCIKYLKILMLSYIKNINLRSENKIVFNALIRFFFYRNYLHYDSYLALDKVIKADPKVAFLEENAELFKRYSKFSDFYKSLIDFGIVRDSFNKLMMTSIRHFGMFSFLSITTSLDYLLAVISVSTFFPTFLKNTSVDTATQNKVERIIHNYSQSLKYDTKVIKWS